MRAIARRTTVVIALAVIMATGPAWADLDLHVGLAATDVSLGEALLIGAVGEFFGVDTQVVAVFRDDNHLGLPEIISATYLSRLGGVEPVDVVGSRSNGHGWGRIAKDLGIHPGEFTKLRKDFDISKTDDAGFEEATWVWFLAEYFGTTRTRVLGLRGTDHNWLSVFLALDFGGKSRCSPATLMTQRSQGGPWESVAQKNGLGADQLQHPSKPIRGRQFRPQTDSDQTSGGPPGHGHGGGQGKGHHK